VRRRADCQPLTRLRKPANNAKRTCAEAITGEDIPAVRGVQRVQGWGLAAQVVMDGDVVFLTTTDGRWTITAAGCRARPGQPYQLLGEGRLTM